MGKVVKGMLIYNRSLWSVAYEAHMNLYVEAAKELGAALDLVTGREVQGYFHKDGYSFGVDVFAYDFILFLDKDVALCKMLEAGGCCVLNSGDCISQCDHKGLTAVALYEKGIPIADTILAPFEYRDSLSLEEKRGYLDGIVGQFGFPLVVKEAYGSYGQQVYLVGNMEELLTLTDELCGKAYLFQRYVASSCGRDVRIYVVGDQVVGSMYRENLEDFRSNLSNGGRMEAYEPSEAMCDLAVRACQAVGGDFVGIDLLFGEKGEMLVCEVNSCPHIKNYYDGFGVNLGKNIVAEGMKRAMLST